MRRRARAWALSTAGESLRETDTSAQLQGGLPQMGGADAGSGHPRRRRCDGPRPSLTAGSSPLGSRTGTNLSIAAVENYDVAMQRMR
jgi:hypothetical protein